MKELKKFYMTDNLLMSQKLKKNLAKKLKSAERELDKSKIELLRKFKKQC